MKGGETLIICSVGKCPVDAISNICCVHCDKNADCENACKRVNKSCVLSLDKDVKKAAL